VTADVFDIRGQQSVCFVLNSHEFEHSFLVCTLPTQAAGLIGTDFMATVRAVLDFERNQMVLPARYKVPRVYNVLPAAHKAFSIFSGGQDGRSPQVREREA
jgi:hypothetical protein